MSQKDLNDHRVGILSYMNRYQDDTTFIDAMHRRLISTLKHDVDIQFAILDGAILSEYLVKEVLRRFNPLLPYNLSQLQNNHRALAYLLYMGPEDSPEARYEDLGLLLRRLKELSLVEFRVVELIEIIREGRNKIVHDPRHTVDILELHSTLIELLANYDNLFNDYMGLALSGRNKSLLLDMLKRLKKKLELRLDNKINKAREEYQKLSKSEKVKLKNAELRVSSQYFKLLDAMLCPSCYNKSLFYLEEMYESEWGIESVEFFMCSICKLEMSHYDFDELNTHPSQYSNLEEADESWGVYYDYIDSQMHGGDFHE